VELARRSEWTICESEANGLARSRFARKGEARGTQPNAEALALGDALTRFTAGSAASCRCTATVEARQRLKWRGS
jgi:hypothetical protein